MKRRSLGRGLDALLGGKLGENQTAAASPEDAFRELPLQMIERGKYQPRRDIKPEALEELAASIRSQGVMQPVVVRPIGGDRQTMAWCFGETNIAGNHSAIYTSAEVGDQLP